MSRLMMLIVLRSSGRLLRRRLRLGRCCRCRILSLIRLLVLRVTLLLRILVFRLLMVMVVVRMFGIWLRFMLFMRFCILCFARVVGIGSLRVIRLLCLGRMSRL